MRIDGKRIVLTGASSGIGKALLERLLAYDVRVVVGDLEPDRVAGPHDRVVATRCDVSQPRELDALFARAQSAMPGIDIFIANAGFAYYEKIEEPSWEHAEIIYRTNVLSPIYAFEKMRALNQGSEFFFVVNASAMAKVPMPGYALYASTKAAIDHFVAGLRHEVEAGAHASG